MRRRGPLLTVLIAVSLLLDVFIWTRVHRDRARLAALGNPPTPPAALTLTVCPKVEVKESHHGCQAADGGTECQFDFLQPEAWGRCVQEKDESLDCELQGKLSHYGMASATPDWTADAARCPELAAQIKKFGQEPMIEEHILIALPPKPRPKT
jgi:hypothetical protein